MASLPKLNKAEFNSIDEAVTHYMSNCAKYPAAELAMTDWVQAHVDRGAIVIKKSFPMKTYIVPVVATYTGSIQIRATTARQAQEAAELNAKQGQDANLLFSSFQYFGTGIEKTKETS